MAIEIMAALRSATEISLQGQLERAHEMICMICGSESLVCVAFGQRRQSKLSFRIDFRELINQVARVKTTELNLWQLTFTKRVKTGLSFD